MERVALRLPPELIRTLEEQAERRGLNLGSFIRNQLIAVVAKPANVLRPVGELSR